MDMFKLLKHQINTLTNNSCLVVFTVMYMLKEVLGEPRAADLSFVGTPCMLSPPECYSESSMSWLLVFVLLSRSLCPGCPGCPLSTGVEVLDLTDQQSH